MIESKRLANYTLDIVPVEEFRTYLNENANSFSTNAMNAYLKALDIPPKFFREQPVETQEELLSNREVFVRENKKFFNKVIVVVTYVHESNGSTDKRILGAARLSESEAAIKFQQLQSIDSVSKKFEHRSFIKDGYVSIIISEGIEKNKGNQVLAVDFPINLNKAPIIHRAIYTLPDETFATPIEHVKYLDSTEVELGVDYNNIKEAIEDNLNFLTEDFENSEAKQILRETELVSLALSELSVIPKSYIEKLTAYIDNNVKGELNTENIESFVLDFDETFKSYKQVTNLRSVSGENLLTFLNSPQFQELSEEMEKIEELALA